MGSDESLSEHVASALASLDAVLVSLATGVACVDAGLVVAARRLVLGRGYLYPNGWVV